MNTVARIILLSGAFLALSSCIFKEAVFKDGFAKPDGSLSGAWKIDEGNNDDKTETALCFLFEADRYLIHYPAMVKNGCYFEARQLKVRDRDLLQLRAFGTAEGKMPGKDDEVWNLAWIAEKKPGQIALRVINDDTKKLGPEGMRKFLEAPESDWNEVFGEAAVFKKTN